MDTLSFSDHCRHCREFAADSSRVIAGIPRIAATATTPLGGGGNQKGRSEPRPV